MWKRFIALRDTTDVERLIEEKRLSREDLILIFESLDINRRAFPEIAEAREAAQKSLYPNKYLL